MLAYGYFSKSAEDHIKRINKDIEEYKRNKRKIVFRKGLCYSAGIGLIAAIGLVLPTAVTVLGCKTNHSPFKKDEIVTPIHVRTEFDSAEGSIVSKQYEEYEREENSLSYHSGWEEINGQYYSTEITYDAKGLTYDEVKDCISGAKNLKNKLQEKTIIKENITEEELATGPHYYGVIYEIDNNGTITTQTSSENVRDIMACIVAPCIVSLTVICYISDYVLPKDFNNMFGKEFNPDHAFGHYSDINDELKDAKRRKRQLVMELKKNSD